MKKLAVALTLVASLLPAIASMPGAQAAPAGFQISTVITGLNIPTGAAFANDGRVFIAEKHGLIKVYDNINDTTPTIFADLSTNVYSFSDRGLLGIELHPDFPSTPYVYALYTYDAVIGGTAPRWGTPGVLSDPCPTPPGPMTDGCVASARLSRLTAVGDQMSEETVLIEDWCGQSPSHTIGTVTFGPDGALYVGGGDGAKPTDWGQFGNPLNPCGDPPGGVGAVLTPPTAEGGSFRAQDLRTSGDPVGLDGTIIRVDPITGEGMPDNPFASSPDPNERRIIAYGMRNPYRFTFRPGTHEIYVGDVGENRVEEIDRVMNARDSFVENFGWPCYEGSPRHGPFDHRDFNICEQMYGQPIATAPFFEYGHALSVYPGDPCPTGGGVLSAIGFYRNGEYPDTYNGALFFGDYARGCIWVMFQDRNGRVDTSTTTVFENQNVGAPVDFEIGPNGDIFFVDVWGRLRRIQYFSSNQPPTADIVADVTSGPAPLTVNFDGSGSTDPENGALTYEWDLDGDTEFDDATDALASHTYTGGEVTASLRVTDPEGSRHTTAVTISAGNNAPVPTIAAPATGFQWRVGEQIIFSGGATDAEDGTLPAQALDWQVILQHCPDEVCHEHPLQDFAGVASGSLAAADHEYPSHLEIRLTATDSVGLSSTTSIDVFPETVDITLDTVPQGLHLEAGAFGGASPFSQTAIVGSSVALAAPELQTLNGDPYQFESWSDGGEMNHQIVVGSAPATYTATYGIAELIGVSIGARGFEPKNVTGPFPRIVRWTNDHTAPHSVVDTTQLNLYDSGSLAPGARFSYEFYAAGRYTYRSTLDPTTSPYTGSVSIPMAADRTTGAVGTPFELSWASIDAPAGFVYDVQIMQPGSSFLIWRRGETLRGATFVPNVAGTYRFHARLRQDGGRATTFSVPLELTVTP
ncbi:MAG: PQQ-dependent sugar dehydrogenase [Actinomycetota bacterium]